jgi:transcriptional regulator with XRE-family HTH domain
MALKDRIKEAMDGAGLTAADLARATKSTNAAVTFWLSGKTKTLKGEKAALLEIATKYNAQWIISGKGEKRMMNTPFIPLENSVSFEQNKPLALMQQAQPATTNIASVDYVLDMMLAQMAQVEPVKRAAIGALLSVLAVHPDDVGTRAALVAMLTPAAFAEAPRKAA